MTSTEAMLILMNDYADDDVGGVVWLTEHFMEIPEPDRSELFDVVFAERERLPKDAQTEISMLAFKCDSGRNRMTQYLEELEVKFGRKI